jgi:hypothetical protein
MRRRIARARVIGARDQLHREQTRRTIDRTKNQTPLLLFLEELDLNCSCRHTRIITHARNLKRSGRCYFWQILGKSYGRRKE